MEKLVVILVIFSITAGLFSLAEKNYCSKAYGCSGDNSIAKATRFVLYDINIGEGFNLKRDVYMRMAMFVRALAAKSDHHWHLVLPPWTKQWHWKTENNLASYPWHYFFHVESLQLYAPVIELDQFYSDYGEEVDEVYILQHFPEFYKWTGKGGQMDWSDRWAFAECRDRPYWEQTDGLSLFFHGKKHVKSKQVRCISFQGSSSYLESVLSSTVAKSVLFDRAEIATHMMYGDTNYWMCRRSMRFAKHLVDTANAFRASHLNSSDEQDRTVRPVDWRHERPHRTAKGGPYLGVHIRRQDFAHGRPKEVPSLNESAVQIKKYLRKLNLDTVFIATDMDAKEYEYLHQTLQKGNIKCIKYEPSEKHHFTEGEVAIVDQIIASHARFFVSTHESTFSYRIQEEREIMGFHEDSTFNRLCPTADRKDCEPPTRWSIKFPEENFSKPTNKHLKMDEL